MEDMLMKENAREITFRTEVEKSWSVLEQITSEGACVSKIISILPVGLAVPERPLAFVAISIIISGLAVG